MGSACDVMPDGLDDAPDDAPAAAGPGPASVYRLLGVPRLMLSNFQQAASTTAFEWKVSWGFLKCYGGPSLWGAFGEMTCDFDFLAEIPA